MNDSKHDLSCRASYIAKVSEFLTNHHDLILGKLSSAQDGDLTHAQRQAWIEQIRILRSSLTDYLDATICFEYIIPRMGKRADNVLLLDNAVIVIEFKVGSTSYDRSAVQQVTDYALDLKNFHAGSRDALVVPILVATKAPVHDNLLQLSSDGVANVLRDNSNTLRHSLNKTSDLKWNKTIDDKAWLQSGYSPTPTIIEASQALYRGHSVQEISRFEAGSDNLGLTTQTLNSIIDNARSTNQKSICLVTGVPGAGKTLAGLNLASERRRIDADHIEHAVFLSGNGPLVSVLQEALARDEVAQAKSHNENLTKKDALRKAKAFIQNIHHFRDECVKNSEPPTERVVVFDEAQRAWNKEQTSKFMQQKKGILDFEMSEPAFLISAMDRHPDWTVIVCLVGGGQEINTGEAGMEEWINAIMDYYPEWTIYVPNQISAKEYLPNTNWSKVEKRVRQCDGLHLGVSIRSFRSEKLSDSISQLLTGHVGLAASAQKEIQAAYPMRLTRSLASAKQWIRSQARGSERYGILTSSGARRLKPLGLFAGSVKSSVCHWFLDNDQDVRSSYYLEDAATEFEVQGLELDWTIVVWDGDLIHDGIDDWKYRSFKGTKWQKINKEEDQRYRLNAYRVLLTRARQGMVIVVPDGNKKDYTRHPDIYDPTWSYLTNCNIPLL